MDEIIENLFVGNAEEGFLMKDYNFTIIDVREKDNKDRNKDAIWLPILVSKENEEHYLMASTKALNKVARIIDDKLKVGRKVLVNCGQGMERAPLCCAWYLYKYKRISLIAAYNIVKAKRPMTTFKYGWLPRSEVLK